MLVDENVNEIKVVQTFSRNIIAAITTGILLVVLLVLIILNRIVLKPLKKFSGIMEEISYGDFYSSH